VLYLRNKYQQDKHFSLLIYSAFGGLGLACWPLVPKFAGSNPAEAESWNV